VPPGIPDLVLKKFLEEVDGALKQQAVAAGRLAAFCIFTLRLHSTCSPPSM